MNKKPADLAPGDMVDNLIVEHTLPMVRKHLFAPAEKFVVIYGIILEWTKCDMLVTPSYAIVHENQTLVVADD
jgi:hypothetical protein